MSSRFWPVKQSILPIIPTTPVTARLNLDCHLLNHPIRARLFQDQLEEDKLVKKPVLEQVLSRRKDHTVPTRWSLYRPLIRNARKMDDLLARIASTEKGEPPAQDSPSLIANTALTKYVRKHWKRNSGMQGYKRVQDWLSVQYELLEEFGKALEGDAKALQKVGEQRKDWISRHTIRKAKKLERVKRKKNKTLEQPSPRSHPSFLPPTLFNIALPRMKPQPLSLSMMIDDRVKRRDRRREGQEQHRQWAQDMLIEEGFWRDLGLVKLLHDSAGKTGGRDPHSRGRPRAGDDEGNLSFTERHYRHVDLLATYFERDAARARTTYTTDMINTVKVARTKREQARQRAAMKHKATILAESNEDLGFQMKS